jgi:hypothetical protein
MKEKIMELSEKIVDIIYTPDQEGLNESFIELMDLLLTFISEGDESRASVLNTELLGIQSAFMKKDYGEMADVLHYDLKEKLERSI